MQTTTGTTSQTAEVLTPDVNLTSASQVNQEDQPNTQANSLIRTLYSRSKWSDTLELLGWIFLAIIVYVVSCELANVAIQHLDSIPKDAFLYRYQCVLSCIIFMNSFMIGIAVTAGSTFGLFRASEYIYVACVKYYYVEGRNSYKWWQKKIIIQSITIFIILLIWLVICIELGRIILEDLKHKKETKAPFPTYQFSGFIGILLCLLSICVYFSIDEPKAMRNYITDELETDLDKKE